jgi:hypothetical protein
MPIRTIPFDQITADHVRDLIKRQVREAPTLDFKQELKLDDSGKLDLLGDVTAMANAVGGTIIYGAVEGEAEDRGLIVDVKGMAIEPDKMELAVSNLLRDNVDQRIHGVLHRAVSLDGATYLYVVRVPASPLAPHMVTRPSNRPRFYLRGTASNDPMNAQQIKEVALRADTAVERARRLIEERTAWVQSRAASRPSTTEAAQMQREKSATLLHFIPILAPAVPLDLADPAVSGRFALVPPLRSESHGGLRWALEGLYVTDGGRGRTWALLTRSGAIEFGEYGVLYVDQWNPDRSVFSIRALETQALAAATQVPKLVDAGLLAPPLVLSLRLLGVGGSYFRHPLKGVEFEGEPLRISEVFVEPLVIADTAAALDKGLRSTFDVVWQAWGLPRSEMYNADGTRRAWPRS